MKIFIPLLTIFAILTQPDGFAIRIAKAQVVAIFRSIPGECGLAPRTESELHSVIMMANGNRLCVTEPPDEAAAAVEQP